MADSVNITQLMDWLEGRLTKEDLKAVEDAVQDQESYQAAISWLQAFLKASRSTVLIEPPGQLIRDVNAEFRAFAQGRRRAGWLQELVARLTSDSWQRQSLVGVRRTGLEAIPRQLVFRAAAADIVLNTRAGRDEDRFDLVGQVFPLDESDPAAFTVQLLQHESEVALTSTSNVGRFTCGDLIAGVYTLIIRGDHAEITIPDVDLSA
jgi:hypothetical protein